MYSTVWFVSCACSRKIQLIVKIFDMEYFNVNNLINFTLQEILILLQYTLKHVKIGPTNYAQTIFLCAHICKHVNRAKL